MKIIKALAVIFIVLILLGVAGGIYFNAKFSPAPNRLDVTGDATNVPFEWVNDPGNPYAALLVPVTLDGLGEPLYMQVDFGTPTTVLYGRTIASMQAHVQGSTGATRKEAEMAAKIRVGGLTVRSAAFKSIDFGSPISHDADQRNLVGTIGADLLEKKAVILDFRNRNISFVSKLPGGPLTSFEFKKRRILIPSAIDGATAMLLYDSGSSGYELITTRERWDAMKTSGGPVRQEKGNSWGKSLTVYTAPTKGQVEIAGARLPLREITYVDGMPAMQKFLMRRSGMQGMIGNKIFLGRRLLLDARSQKLRVE
jgi:hypothetical protein